MFGCFGLESRCACSEGRADFWPHGHWVYSVCSYYWLRLWASTRTFAKAVNHPIAQHPLQIGDPYEQMSESLSQPGEQALRLRVEDVVYL